MVISWAKRIRFSNTPLGSARRERRSLFLAPILIRDDAVVSSVCWTYPTLLDMCNLPQNAMCEGRSLQPLLDNPGTPWPYPAVIHCRRGHVAVQSETHRYIRYEDGSEEVYDHTKDPNEWTNLATQAQASEIKNTYRQKAICDSSIQRTPRDGRSQYRPLHYATHTEGHR